MNFALLQQYATYERLGPVHVRPVEQWPGGLTERRPLASFTASTSSTCKLLALELRMLGARDVVIQVALDERDLRRDGLPRADARYVHPGVIVSFTSPRAGGTVRIATDLFRSVEDNLRAVALGLEALRKVDRYGITKGGEQYTGWLAIEPPAPAMTADAAARMLLRVSGYEGFEPLHQFWSSVSVRRAVWREIVRRYHPDAGGDADRWLELDRAFRLVNEAVTTGIGREVAG